MKLTFVKMIFPVTVKRRYGSCSWRWGTLKFQGATKATHCLSSDRISTRAYLRAEPECENLDVRLLFWIPGNTEGSAGQKGSFHLSQIRSQPFAVSSTSSCPAIISANSSAVEQPLFSCVSPRPIAFLPAPHALPGVCVAANECLRAKQRKLS